MQRPNVNYLRKGDYHSTIHTVEAKGRLPELVYFGINIILS